jgi:hypothetical protein
MKKRINNLLCDFALGFLDWGYRNFGTEDKADWEWMDETRAKFRGARIA